jgi:ubiquinol-cytochrome c reductase iron-sulfur subunit
MSQDGVNNSRRLLLLGSTAAFGAVGAGFVAIPCFMES